MSHHEAQQQPPCRSSDHNQVCKAYLHFIPPPTSRGLQRCLSTRSILLRTASLRFPLLAITAAARSLFATPCHGSVAAASLQSQFRAEFAGQVGRGLQRRRDGRFRTETIQVQDSDGRMIYAMLQV